MSNSVTKSQQRQSLQYHQMSKPISGQRSDNAKDKKYPHDVHRSKKTTEKKQVKVEESREFFQKIKRERLKKERESLPIFSMRDDFLKAFSENQIMIVIGDTGSGKSTQIPQYLLEAGYAKHGRIGVTQPRRIAASSVASRVSEERECKVGAEVGYCIRFEDCTSEETVIKYMTDGILLNETLKNPTLVGYSVIMLDEAHERTLNTDVLLGLLKDAVSKRNDLKLLVTSATLDKEKFSQYYNNACIFEIPGNAYPVEIVYSDGVYSGNSAVSLNAVENKIIEIHRKEKPGDILVFLAGQSEIESLCSSLETRLREFGSLEKGMTIVPLFSAMDYEEQMIAFAPTPPGERKVHYFRTTRVSLNFPMSVYSRKDVVVVATNIAESSLTINGIVYVIDSGLCKQNVYKPKTRICSLQTILISQAQAKQRAGRAGRTAPGKCFRLYTEHVFNYEMPRLFVPEIQRTDIASVVLHLKILGLQNVVGFDFMDAPPSEAMQAAFFQLVLLDALNSDFTVTELGIKMARLPMEPQLAKYLIESSERGCSDEVMTITSLLSVQNFHRIFRNPQARKDESAFKHRLFFLPQGDDLTLLNVYNCWRQHNYSSQWCYDNFLSFDVLLRAQEIRGQLVSFMDQMGLPIVTCGENYSLVQKTACATFFYNAAKREAQIRHMLSGSSYRALLTKEIGFIGRSSCTYSEHPLWIVYQKMQGYNKSYFHQVTVIEPEWLVEVAPKYFHQNHYGTECIFANTAYQKLFESVNDEVNRQLRLTSNS